MAARTSVKKGTPQQRHAKAEYSKIPTRTKADDPRKYTKISHDFDQLITGGKLGGALQRDLLYWIARNTVGANLSRNPEKVIRPEYAKLTLGALAKLCQTWDEEKGKLRPAERKSIAVALADLERRGIIEARDRTGCQKTTAKMYKLTPERWKQAEPYKPPTPRQLAEAAEAAAEDDEEADSGADASSEPTGPSVVHPGKSSRPQNVTLEVGKGAPAVHIRVVYHAEGFDQPISFRSRTGRNGRIQITAAPHTISEEEAKRCSRAQLQQFAKYSPIKSPVSEETIRVNEYREWITDLVSTIWAKIPDRPFLESIISESKGAPVQYLKAAVDAKIREKKLKASGILLYCAREAAGVHQRDQAREKARQPRATGDGNWATFAEIEAAEKTSQEGKAKR